MVWFYRILLAFTFIAVPLISSAAKNYDKKYESAIATYNNKEYIGAYRQFKYVAKKGRASGQYWLAILYAAGKGVRRNHEKAFRWFRDIYGNQ